MEQGLAIVGIGIMMYLVPFVLARWGLADGRPRPGCALLFVACMVLPIVGMCSQLTESGVAGQSFSGWFLALIAIAAAGTALRFAETARLDDESRHGTLSPTRAEFLQYIFGLSTQDCRLMCFDGQTLVFGRLSYPWTDFTHVQLLSSEVVQVHDEKLPHTTSYRHTCLDGSPDRRFSSNPVKRYSRRIQFEFSGSRYQVLRTFAYPFTTAQECERAALIFTHFLECASTISTNELFASFDDAKQALGVSERLMVEAETRQREAQRVLALAHSLPQPLFHADVQAQAGLSAAAATAATASLQVDALRTQIDIDRARAAKILQDGKALVDSQRDLRIVRQYRAP